MTFTLTPASCSHRTSTSLDAFSTVHFIFYVQEDFFKVLHGHVQAPPGHFERAAGHIKVTYPLIDSGCHHGKIVYRSMDLISRMRVTSSYFFAV